MRTPANNNNEYSSSWHACESILVKRRSQCDTYVTFLHVVHVGEIPREGLAEIGRTVVLLFRRFLFSKAAIQNEVVLFKKMGRAWHARID